MIVFSFAVSEFLFVARRKACERSEDRRNYGYFKKTYLTAELFFFAKMMNVSCLGGTALTVAAYTERN